MILTVGFDEAGRGPLAGPVTAGCVILPSDFPFEILNDSKKLSEKKREAAELVIKEKALWGIGIVDHLKDSIAFLSVSIKIPRYIMFAKYSGTSIFLSNSGKRYILSADILHCFLF